MFKRAVQSFAVVRLGSTIANDSNINKTLVFCSFLGPGTICMVSASVPVSGVSLGVHPKANAWYRLALFIFHL